MFLSRMILCFLLLPYLLVACSEKPAERSKDLQSYVDGLLEINFMDLTPGVVLAVMQGDDLIYEGARGMASVELGVKLDVQQIGRIGSVTKQMTAAAVLTLVDKGKIELGAPLSKYLPAYPNGQNVTVRQLLNHTSGIKSYTSIEGIMAGPIRMDVTTPKLIDSFKDHDNDFVPGEGWAYNNSGYVLLGAIIEEVTGEAWYQYLQKDIFIPNGLKKTEFGGNEQLILNSVPGYTLADGNLAPAGFVSMSQPHASGALVSNVKDLLRWNRLLHAGELLEAGSYEEMTTPQGKAKKANYGFGIERQQLRGKTMLAHGGGIHGFSSYLLYIPEDEIGVAIIQNSDSPMSDMRLDELAMRIAAFTIGEPLAEPIVVDLGKNELGDYEGLYADGDQLSYELRVIGSKLTIKKDGGVPKPLMPVGEGRFLFSNGMDTLTVERDVDDRVKGIVIQPVADATGLRVPLKDKVLPELASTLATISVEQLKRLIGKYAGGPNLVLHVAINTNNKLEVRLQGQGALEALPQSQHMYFLAETGASLEFAEGAFAPSVTLKQAGRSVELARVAN